MKKLSICLLAAASLLVGSKASAQRYLTEVFTDAQITITNDVQYAQNISVLATILAALQQQTPPPPDTIALRMDVYQPSQSVDTEDERPLIIYLPTGNFLPPVVNGAPTGSRKDSSCINIAKQFAKRGYVCAVVEYRQGWNPVSTSQVVRTGTILNAAYRGQQDSKAAVRFFRADRATTNNYKIDPNRVALLGEGTGGYVAMAHAFLDKPWKISRLPGLGDDKFLRTQNPDSSVVDTNRVGNFDGTNNIPLNLMDFALSGGDLLKVTGNVANNPGYPSDVQLVMNMGGALGDTSWLDPGQIPMIGIHAVRDPNAPHQIGDVIVPTTGDLVIPFASGAGFNLARANQYGNNASFANIQYNDPITAIVESRYNQNIPFGPATINTGSGKGLLPFILPEAPVFQNNHGSPWQFWSSTQTTAILPIPGTNPPVTTHQAGIQSNTFMAQGDAVGRQRALQYIDTVQQYVNPRIVCALDLPECDMVGIRNVEQTASAIEAYPNPARNEVNIRVKNPGASITAWTLIDPTGRVVATQQNIKEQQVLVSRKGLAAGLYLLKFETTNGSGSTRVVFE